MPSRFYVTYCLMGPASAANIFGHSCLILSQKNEDDSETAVQGMYGFYSQLSTVTPEKEPIWYYIKKILGIKYDLQGGHGVLKKELIREFVGDGLQGKTYLVDENKFNQLRVRLEGQIAQEQKAISELDRTLGIDSNGQTRYAKDGHNKRLTRFHFNLPANKDTYTCKTHALTILQEAEVINQQEFDELNGGWLASLPYFSGITLSDIRFVDTGEKTEYTSNSGNVYYNPSESGLLCFVGDEANPSYSSITKVLRRANQLEQTALRSKEDYKNRDIVITGMQEVREIFSHKEKNANSDYTASQLRLAKIRLYNAMEILHPELVDSFPRRMYENASARHALLGLLIISVALPVINTAMGALFFMAALLYTVYNVYDFFESERDFQEMADYGRAPITQP